MYSLKILIPCAHVHSNTTTANSTHYSQHKGKTYSHQVQISLELGLKQVHTDLTIGFACLAAILLGLYLGIHLRLWFLFRTKLWFHIQLKLHAWTRWTNPMAKHVRPLYFHTLLITPTVLLIVKCKYMQIYLYITHTHIYIYIHIDVDVRSFVWPQVI